MDSGLGYLFAAFFVAWLVLVLYVWNLSGRLNGPGLVVREHYTDQPHLGAQQARQSSGIHNSRSVHGQAVEDTTGSLASGTVSVNQRSSLRTVRMTKACAQG